MESHLKMRKGVGNFYYLIISIYEFCGETAYFESNLVMIYIYFNPQRSHIRNTPRETNSHIFIMEKYLNIFEVDLVKTIMWRLGMGSWI